MVEQKIDRRKFLKYTSAGLFSTLFLNEFSPLFAEISSSGKNVSFLSKEFRKGIPTFCNLCPAQCGVIGFVEHDFLAGIQGNPLHPNNRGKICARGIAGMNMVYDPDRQLFPLKRKGKRGAGDWEPITWQQALGEIGNRLNALQRQGKADEILFTSQERYLSGLTERFINTFQSAQVLVSSVFTDPNKNYAQKTTWGENTEIADVENSDFILSFGANLYESHPQFVNISQRIIEAKMNNGAKIVTIDPRMSNTAGRSDEWLPILPGTDAIVALAMANVIMQNNLHDAEFITRYTNVSVSELGNYLSRFSPEKAAEISTIPAETIKSLGLNFASRRHPVAISGGGITRRSNGVQNERCVMLLNAVVGNIDKKGGFCVPRQFNLDGFSPELDFARVPADYYQILSQSKSKIDTLISFKSNPVFDEPNSELMKDLFSDESKIPFTVAIDSVMSETALMADIFLPAATHMESWDISIAPSFDLIPQVTLSQPVIAPHGESKSLAEIWILLAAYMGGEFTRKLNYKNIENYIKEIATQIPGLTPNDDYDLLKKKGRWVQKNVSKQYEIYKSDRFKTQSGRFEIASSELRRKGEFELPTYVPLNENVMLQRDQLYLIPFSTNVITPNVGNSKWLSEISHTNEALINPITAHKLGIRAGHKIKLKSASGEIEAEMRLFQGIHPKAIALRSGLGHWAYGNFAMGKKATSADPDSELLWWEKQHNGVNTNILIEIGKDATGFGLSENDTVISIEKA